MHKIKLKGNDVTQVARRFEFLDLTKSPCRQI